MRSPARISEHPKKKNDLLECWARLVALAYSPSMNANMQTPPPPAPPTLNGSSGSGPAPEEPARPTPSDFLDHFLYGLRTAETSDAAHAWETESPSPALLASTLTYWRALAHLIDTARVEVGYGAVREYLATLPDDLPHSPEWDAALTALEALEAPGVEPVR